MASYQHYQVRLSKPYCDISGVIANLQQKTHGPILVFEHTPDKGCQRHHCHAYFFDIDLKYDAISERVKKFKLAGNKDFAISGTVGDKAEALDLSGAYWYGSGGTLDPYPALRPVYTHKLPGDVEEELRAYSLKLVSRKPGNQKEQKTVKEPKLTQWGMITEMLTLVGTDYFHLSESRRVDYLEDLTSRYLNEKMIFCGIYKQQDYIFCILRALGDETYKQALRSRVQKCLNLI